MKKIIQGLILTLLIFIIPNNVYAQNTSVEVTVNGNIKKNNNIEILVNIKNVEQLYAASIDYEYDKTLLKIQSIEAGSFIKNDKLNIMEFGQETEKNGNIANYYFTCLGDQEGIKGSGNFVKIKAKVLRDGRLSINSNNMKIKLVQKTIKNEIINLKFTYNGYNSTNIGMENDNTESGSNGSSNGNTGTGNNNTESGSNGSLSGNTGIENNNTESESNGSLSGNTGIENNDTESGSNGSSNGNTGTGNNSTGSGSNVSLNDTVTENKNIYNGNNDSLNNNNIASNNNGNLDSNNQNNSSVSNSLDTEILTQDTVVKGYKTNNTYLIVIIIIIIGVLGYIICKKSINKKY